jgi:hypothetical protein
MFEIEVKEQISVIERVIMHQKHGALVLWHHYEQETNELFRN